MRSSDPNDPIIAYQVRCPKSLLDRIELASKSLGISKAAYIRMAIIQRMNQDGIPESPPKARRK